jgi:hypothetical protein
MITNTGKNILAKYLIGQAPAYASYVALGCGPTPVSLDATLGDYSAKQSLDFEMFRVPITSRGYVNEDGISKVVLTAELPTDERYEISEVGVYSAGSNPLAGAYDSKSIYAFTKDENWEYHQTSSAIAIPIVYDPLDGSDNDNIINQTSKVFQTNADNRIFTDQNRINRYETCRFFNNTVMMAGNTSNLTVNAGHLVVNSGSEHVHIQGVNLDFNKNAPTDVLKLAFSVANKNGTDTDIPDSVRVLLEFSSADTHNTGEWARFEAILNKEDYDFETNRYFVVTKQLQQLYKSSGFTWSLVDVVSIYSSVIQNNQTTNRFYVCLDAIRFENTNSTNPLYGLTGYSVIKNKNAQTIIKAANTTNYIEFRFAMDVQ